MNALVIDKLQLAPQTIDLDTVRQYSHLHELEDELSYEKARPTILIGQDNWHLIVSREVVQKNRDQPAASYTKLGWVLHGRENGIARPVHVINYIAREPSAEDEIDSQLTRKRYAEPAPEAPASPRTWYLPHFAVVHPQKGKIRLVFDAAARTAGRSLNDALLPEPDLLQSLFGVLLRFREGRVAVVADIREMFLQVKIREEDRDSLRFLWRKMRTKSPRIKGWASNEPDALVATESLRREQKALSIGDHTERTLGLIWKTKNDTLSFSLNLRNCPREVIQGYRPPTKREVTSAVMSVFDPIGFAAPITVLGKMLIQNIWRDRNDWDHELSKERDKEWREWLSHLKKLDKLEIPRCVTPYHTEGELHVFTDASEKAYSAAVYWLEKNQKPPHVALVAAKAR
ncbi:hypothetical protein EVAR_92946_1 [Eumeta japonica]|uniref:Uncharacterized protein n=1 Tax=Eumeta variegata TaxID=151549 RepID=A0A4C1TDH5_EUMVA|nr:hypothetical protein EVAR_92946_1 [Eumeta japonica]